MTKKHARRREAATPSFAPAGQIGTYGREVAIPVDLRLAVVVVRTKDDTMIAGLLERADPEGGVLILRGAQKMTPQKGAGAPPAMVAMDGLVVIPWANVDYWQEGLPPELLARA